jgi:gamma-butyrobetaine dioxygenase
MSLSNAELLEGGAVARLAWRDGMTARFHALWLRDNALDPETRSAGNGQRLITILDIPRETIMSDLAVTGQGDLRVRFSPEAKEVTFPAAWLRARRYDQNTRNEPGWISPDLELWDSALQARVPDGSYPTLKTHRHALGLWLAAVRRTGFAVLRDVPRESGSLCAVAELFGYVRETNYGRWFEVRAEVNPNNLAYTNLGLQAHTDNPYRDPVPTLQLLACLENSVEGGDSIVVDGFSVAKRLQTENPRKLRPPLPDSARALSPGSAGGGPARVVH